MSRLKVVVLLSLLCLGAAAPSFAGEVIMFGTSDPNQCLVEQAALAGPADSAEQALPLDFVAHAVQMATRCTSSSQCPCPPPACYCFSNGNCICDLRLCCFGGECP